VVVVVVVVAVGERGEMKVPVFGFQLCRNPKEGGEFAPFDENGKSG